MVINLNEELNKRGVVFDGPKHAWFKDGKQITSIELIDILNTKVLPECKAESNKVIPVKVESIKETIPPVISDLKSEKVKSDKINAMRKLRESLQRKK